MFQIRIEMEMAGRELERLFAFAAEKSDSYNQWDYYKGDRKLLTVCPNEQMVLMQLDLQEYSDFSKLRIMHKLAS